MMLEWAEFFDAAKGWLSVAAAGFVIAFCLTAPVHCTASGSTLLGDFGQNCDWFECWNGTTIAENQGNASCTNALGKQAFADHQQEGTVIAAVLAFVCGGIAKFLGHEASRRRKAEDGGGVDP